MCIHENDELSMREPDLLFYVHSAHPHTTVSKSIISVSSSLVQFGATNELRERNEFTSCTVIDQFTCTQLITIHRDYKLI